MSLGGRIGGGHIIDFGVTVTKMDKLVHQNACDLLQFDLIKAGKRGGWRECIIMCKCNFRGSGVIRKRGVKLCAGSKFCGK